MVSAAPRRRGKVSVSVDAALLAAVDGFVAARPGIDRSRVFDAALRLWYAQRLDSALAFQYAQSDGVDPAERTAWDVLADAAAVDGLRSTQRARKGG